MSAKMGPPYGSKNASKYKRIYCKKIIEMSLEGASFTAFASSIGVNRDTVNDWCEQWPEFAIAKQQAYENALAFFEQVGLDQATGKSKGSATTLMFLMRCRFRSDYCIKETNEVLDNTNEIKDTLTNLFSALREDSSTKS
jgi:hypothetical protein